MSNPAKPVNTDLDFGGVSRPINVPTPALSGDGVPKSYVDNSLTGLFPVSDSGALIKNASDNTKLLRISAANITTATTRVVTALDADIYMAGYSALPTANRIPYTNSSGVLSSTGNATLDSSGNVTLAGYIKSAYADVKGLFSATRQDMIGLEDSGATYRWGIGISAVNDLYFNDTVNNKDVLTLKVGAVYTTAQLAASGTLAFGGSTSIIGLSSNATLSNVLEVNRGKILANAGGLGGLIARDLYISGATTMTSYSKITGTFTGIRTTTVPDMTATLLGTAGLTAGRLPYAASIDAGVGLADSANATLDSSGNIVLAGNLTSAGTVQGAFLTAKGTFSATRQDMTAWVDSAGVYRWASGIDASNNLYFNDQANNKDVLTLLVGAIYTTARLPANGTLSFNGGVTTIGLSSSATISNALEVNRGKILANSGGMGSVIARDYYFTGSTAGTPYGQITGTLTANRVYTFPDASLTMAGSSGALTAGRVPYVASGGVLVDSANFLWDSSAGLTVKGGSGTVGIAFIDTAYNSVGWSLQATRNGANSGWRLLDNNTGVTALSVDSSDMVSVNGTAAGIAQLAVYNGSASRVGLIIQLAATPTANAVTVQDSSAGALAIIDNNGLIRSYRPSVASQYIQMASPNSGGGYIETVNASEKAFGFKNSSGGSTIASSFQWYINGTIYQMLWSGALQLASTTPIFWAGTANASATVDTGIGRNAAGIVEVNQGVAGTYGDLRARYAGFGAAPASPYSIKTGNSFALDTEGAAEFYGNGSVVLSGASVTNRYGVLMAPFAQTSTTRAFTNVIGFSSIPQMYLANTSGATVGITNAYNFQGAGTIYSSSTAGTISNFYGFYQGQITNAAVAASINVTNIYGFATGNIATALSNSITFTSAAGVAIAALSGATNHTHLLLGTTSIPTGNYGVYNLASVSGQIMFYGKAASGQTGRLIQLADNAGAVNFEVLASGSNLNLTNTSTNGGANISVTANGTGTANLSLIGGATGGSTLNWYQNGIQSWLFYMNPGDTAFYFRDVVNSRMQMQFAPGATADAAIVYGLARSVWGNTSSDPGGTLNVISSSSTRVAMVAKAAASATVAIQIWQDNSGNALAAVNASGMLVIGNTSTNYDRAVWIRSPYYDSSTTTYGFLNNANVPTTSTSGHYRFYAQAATSAAVYTVALDYGFYVAAPSIGAGSAITTVAGLLIQGQKVSGVTNGYGVYQAGTSDLNYFAGQVAINNGARWTDNTGNISLAVGMTNASPKAGIYVTDNFNFDSNSAYVSSYVTTAGTNKMALFAGIQKPSASTAVNGGPNGAWTAYFYGRSADTGVGVINARSVVQDNAPGNVYVIAAHGYYQFSSATTTATNHYQFYSLPQFATSTVTVGSWFDYYVGTITGGANGTITSRYGLYIASDTTGVTTNYGVYQSDANTRNFFNGFVGIGTAPTTTQRLAVVSSLVNNSDTGLYVQANTAAAASAATYGAIISNTASSGAGASAAIYGLNARAQYTGTSNPPASIYANQSSIDFSGTGTVSTAKVFNTAPSGTGGGTYTNFYHYTLTDVFLSNATVLTNQAGIAIPALSSGTNNTQILLGTQTIPSGSYAIYQTGASTYSYIQGHVGITTLPQTVVALSLNKSFATASANQYGIQSYFSISDGGAADQHAFYTTAYYNGTVTAHTASVYGVRANTVHNGTQTIAQMGTFFANPQLWNTGNITTAFNYRAYGASITGAGTIGTLYGLLIDAQKITGVTTGYGIYQSGASDLNYFAGNVAVGSTGYLATVPFSVVKANASNFAAYVGNTSSTAGTSYGLLIDAGTNASDQPFKIRDYSGTNILHTINGYGATSIFLAAASAIGLLIKAAASHTANLLEVDDSGSNSLFNVSWPNNTDAKVTIGYASAVNSSLKIFSNGSTSAQFPYLEFFRSGDIQSVLAHPGNNDFVYAANPASLSSTNIAAASKFRIAATGGFVTGASNMIFGWSSNTQANGGIDTGLYRNAAGIVEINNGTAGSYRDLYLRNLTSQAGTVQSVTYQTDGSTGSLYRLGSYDIIAKLDSGGGWGGGYNLDWNNASPTHQTTGATTGYAWTSTGIRLYADVSQAGATSLSGAVRFYIPVASPYNVQLGTSQVFGFTSSGDATGTLDVGIARNQANAIEINTGTAGSYADVRARCIAFGTVPSWTASYTALRINPTGNDLEGALLINTQGILAATTANYSAMTGQYQQTIFRSAAFKISTITGLGVIGFLRPEMTLSTDIAGDAVQVITAYPAIYGGGSTRGTYTNVYNIRSSQLSNQIAGGTFVVTNNYGLYVDNLGTPSGNSGATIGNAAGVCINAQSGATNNVGLLIGTSSIPSGSFAIYTSAGNNRFAGNSAFGGTSIDSNIICNVNSNSTDPAAAQTGFLGQKNLAMTANNSQQIVGVAGTADTTSGNFNATGIIAGFYGQVLHQVTGTMTQAYGNINVIYNVSSGTMTSAYGFLSRYQNLNASGVITNAYNFYANDPNGFNSGTITNQYGLYVANPPSGTLTNNYGVYVENMTRGGTLNYALYTAGGAVVHVSGTASVVPLSIKAVASQTGDLQQWIDSGSTAQLFVRAEAKSLTWASSGTIRGVASNELDFNDAGNTTTYALWKLQSAGYLQLRGDWFLNFAGSTSNATTAADVALYRNSAGVIEVNSGTAGTYRDLKLRDLISTRSIVFGPNSREPITIDTGAFPATTITVDVDVQSVYWYNTSAAANTFAVDLKAATTGMNTLLSTGQQLTTLLCIKQGASGASYYATSIKVEGTTTGVTTIWVGGAPSAGNANGTDVYQFTIVKTAASTYTVFASLVQYK